MSTTRDASGTRPALLGRTAVITGGSSGIGAATAGELRRAGASVALLARRTARLAELARSLPGDGDVLALPTDVRDPYALAAAREDIHDRLGPVDLVIAGAGVMSGGPFEDSVPGEWDDMIDVNLRGVLHTAQTFAADLLAAAADDRTSDLVVIGALAGDVPFPSYAVYSAIEAGVAQLTRTLRTELGPRGVRVRNIQPGLTATELGTAMSDVTTRRDWDRLRADVTPIDPRHVAATVVHTSAQPPHVNVADLTILPTVQDSTLPTIRPAGIRSATLLSSTRGSTP